MIERNIRLVLAYDGTDFSGWQRQTGRRTVQGELEKALETMHQHPVAVAGAGRTDAGVHAAGQAANFYTSIAHIPANRFVPALNGVLPSDIRILDAGDMPSDFHARFTAQSRTYRYQFICGRYGLPSELRYALQLWRYPRIEMLNDYARLLHGEIDCSLFAAASDASHSRYRNVHNAYFFVQGQVLVFEITANAFLRTMVRSIVGTLLFYEEHNLALSALARIIASGDRRRAGPTVRPSGLFLWKVAY
jgi:tRNA pseudouridine38-40 synthase